MGCYFFVIVVQREKVGTSNRDIYLETVSVTVRIASVVVVFGSLCRLHRDKVEREEYSFHSTMVYRRY